MSETETATAQTTPVHRENLLVNLICNIALPTVILSYLSEDRWLGPVWGLIVALAFPLGYGLYDFAKRRKTNFISIIGLVSVLLSGGFGLLKVGGFWFAVKDGAIPALIGAMVLISQRSSRPMVRELLYNEQVINVPKIDAALEERGSRPAFDGLLARASYWLAFGFLLSAVLNFSLAKYLLKSPPGTPEFNAELGRMHLLSWPVIVLPCMVIMMFTLYRLLKGIGDLTGLSSEELFREHVRKE